MRYDLVIFDFDGTLADTTEWMMGILNVMAQRHGYKQISREEMVRLRGRSTQYVMKTLGIRPWRLPLIAADMRRQSEKDAKSIALFPEAAGTLRELADSGVTLAIVSSNSEATIRSVLGEAQHLIDAYSCQASLFGKASRLRRVAGRLAFPPGRALYVGDETRDIEAAFDAGMAVAAATWGYSHPQALERATHLLTRLSDLEDLLLEPRPSMLENQ